MTFKEALKAMKRGAKVRLPGWLAYYWYWDEEKETVMTHSKPLLTGSEENETDIKDERVGRVFDDMLREDWMIANEENCPILCDKAVFSFGDAIAYLKKGRKVSRKGWKGKGMFLFIADEIHFFTKTELKKENDEPYDMLPSITMKTADNKCVVGWVPTQADMLAEDWVFAE
jgi:hypothetical protein